MRWDGKCDRRIRTQEIGQFNSHEHGAGVTHQRNQVQVFTKTDERLSVQWGGHISYLPFGRRFSPNLARY